MTNAEKLAKLRTQLENLEAKKDAILATGQSWKLRNGEDTREVVNVSLAELNREIEATERKIEQLENSCRARRSAEYASKERCYEF